MLRPYFFYATTELRALEQSMKQFAYEPRSIPPTLLNMLHQDTRQYHPNGCNECSTGRLAVWIAPGDLC